jgi:hypothetical protein
MGAKGLWKPPLSGTRVTRKLQAEMIRVLLSGKTTLCSLLWWTDMHVRSASLALRCDVR